MEFVILGNDVASLTAISTASCATRPMLPGIQVRMIENFINLGDEKSM